jgi:hypothetical protein
MRWTIYLALAFAIDSCGGDKTGAACSTDTDCGGGFACVYSIADACAAKPSCQPLPTGAQCGGGILYCACSGDSIGVGCGDPSGYAPAPVTGPKQGLTCGPPDAAAE